MKKSKIIVNGLCRKNSASNIFPFALSKEELNGIKGGDGSSCTTLRYCADGRRSVCKNGYAIYCTVHFLCSDKYIFYPTEIVSL